MSLDEQQLEDRFFEGFDAYSKQVLTLHMPPEIKVDESKPWCRFSVSLGDKFRGENAADPAYIQLGGVYLQVFIPKEKGIGRDDGMISKFEDLFMDWVSPDGLLETGRFTRSAQEKSDHYQVTLRFAFQSQRKRT